MSQPLRTLKDAIEYLARRTDYERRDRQRYHPGAGDLDRMQALLELLGRPERTYPTFHIGGSKGKGTTALLLEAILLEEGIHTGTYTSPHLVRLTERIRVDGRELAAREFIAALEALRSVAEALESSPTFFEILTATAMETFRSRRVDLGIFEVGLGGRLDATNVLAPRASAVVQIGREHTAQLGSTLESIAREKAGIIKPETPFLLGRVPEPAGEIFRRRAAAVGAPLLELGRDLSTEHRDGGLFDALGPALARPYRGLTLGRPGRHLADDATLAIGLAQWLPGGPPREDSVRRALAKVSLPARVEFLAGPPLVLLDGAHTAESVAELARVVSETRRPEEVVLVFAVARDKELDAILERLPAMATRIVLTLADEIRGSDPAELQERLGRPPGVEIRVRRSPQGAFELARNWAGPDDLVCVTGSFYLAGLIRAGLVPAAGPDGE